MREILPQIEGIIAPIIENSGYELVDITTVGVAFSSVLRVFVYGHNGITIDEIAKLSRKISEALDSTDIMHKRYFLEVSSPGLDRPLRSVRDFVRAIDENVRIVKSTGETIEGILSSADSQSIIIRNDDTQIEIPITEIAVGKIIV